MSMNFDLIGKTTEPRVHKVGWKDVVTYALGVGARASELDFLSELRGPKVLPTFATVPSFTALLDLLGRLDVDFKMIVHGEQTIILHRPIPPKGEFSTSATVTGIYDKGKGALVVIETKTTDGDGSPVFDNVFSIFVRGAGGFGGDRGPESAVAGPPNRAPDFEHVETTSEEQALLYRLSGDLNPLHADPDMAKKVGFDKPILHGLCTYGHAGRAIILHGCAGDPERLRSFSARFSGIVYPGDTLTTRGWQVEPGRFAIEVSAGPDRIVINNSTAVVSS